MRAVNPGPVVSRATAGIVLLGGGLLLAAPTASAEILVTADRSESVPLASVLLLPDGTARPLAAGPLGSGNVLSRPILSPDHRVAAYYDPPRTVLVPTDGGAATKIVTKIGARADEDGPDDVGLWWEGDSTRLSFVGITTDFERFRVQSCVVATRTCSSSTPPSYDLAGTLASGTSVWVRGGEFEVSDGDAVLERRWRPVSRSRLRALRGLLRRPRPQAIVRDPVDGAATVISNTRRRPSAGVESVSAIVDTGSQMVVDTTKTRFVLRTRTRHGRTEARIFRPSSAQTFALISDTGGVRPFAFRIPTGTSLARRGISRDARFTVGIPGGLLLGLRSAGGTPLVGRADGSGTVRSLEVAGRPLTARRLNAALGLPAPDPEEEDRILELRPIGYEAATDSDVVAYRLPGDEEGSYPTVLARVPRDGSSPSIAYRGAPKDDVNATAW